MLWLMIERHKPQRRARRSREEVAAFLSDFQESGLSQVAFAREKNLNVWTLRSWLARRSEGSDRHDVRPKEFCAVTLRKGNGPFVVRLPGGIEIEVSSQIDPRWMVELVKGLQS